MSDARNVWVFIEVVRGKIKGVSLELLGQGRKWQMTWERN